MVNVLLCCTGRQVAMHVLSTVFYPEKLNLDITKFVNLVIHVISTVS